MVCCSCEWAGGRVARVLCTFVVGGEEGGY